VRLIFAPGAWQDYLYWQESNPAVLSRVNELIKDASRTPFTAIGKPEPLSGNYSGWWSRRITREHRLLYRVAGSGTQRFLEIASCRFHYQD
jgi:toxin YoeB